MQFSSPVSLRGVENDLNELMHAENPLAYQDAQALLQNEADGIDNPFRYCGEYQDAETGLIYLRARYYDPTTSRFINEDPIRDGNNWYAYCAGNPVNYWDPSGHMPTVMEAALMAKHIYGNYNMSSEGLSSRQISKGGWRLVNIWYGRETMKMGIYLRGDVSSSYKGPVEYCLVFKGSTFDFFNPNETFNVWKNNAEQYISAKSADMWDAIEKAKQFVVKVGKIEVTIVGHSKGGAEATAAAVATNKAAITFNPMIANLSDYRVNANNYNIGKMRHFIVKNEVLNILFKEPPVGRSIYLPTQHVLIPDILGIPLNIVISAYNAVGMIQNHSMESVIAALGEKGYK